MVLIQSYLASLLLFTTTVSSTCDSFSPAFQLPTLSPNDPAIKKAHSKILQAVSDSYAYLDSNTTSFSIEVTSSTSTLFSIHHTAAEQDPIRPGTSVVSSSSRYRIASVTKAFTVLAILQQQIAGKLNLDDPVNKYIPELGEKGTGLIPWKDISIRALASQLSGIPRDIGIQEFLTRVDDPTKYGLPPVSREGLLTCGEFADNKVPCTASDLLSYIDKKEPLLAPKQQSTYSNINFDLLGLVVENVTGMSYERYVEENILKELGMSGTSFERPKDEVSVLEKGHTGNWDIELGIQRATGGLYSTSADLATYIRYILTHYNGLTPALNWLSPSSYATGLNSFYGTPWEILRTSTLLPHTARPVTFVNKGGSLPSYRTWFSMVPEYGFGFTVLVAGSDVLQMRLSSIVGEIMVQAAEEMAQRQSREAHVGTFDVVLSKDKQSVNSSFEVQHSPERGLYVGEWISNGTDGLHGYLDLIGQISEEGGPNVRLQLVPTLLFKDEAEKKGEIWRLVPVMEDEGHGHGGVDDDDDEEGEKFDLFDDMCSTDIDYASYGGVPLNEVVFWDEDDNGRFGSVELTGYRIKLGRDEKDRSDSGLRKSSGHDKALDEFVEEMQRVLKMEDPEEVGDLRGHLEAEELPAEDQPMVLTDGLGNVFGEDW